MQVCCMYADKVEHTHMSKELANYSYILQRNKELGIWDLLFCAYHLMYDRIDIQHYI